MFSKNSFKVPIGNGMYLMAEKNSDSNYNEIFIDLINNNGDWIQQIAVIRPAYNYEKDNLFEPETSIGVIVYDDVNNKDYKHKLPIWNEEN